MALWKLSVDELNNGYGGGQFTPVDVLDETLARIRVVNPTLNAIITTNESGAAKAARQSAARWRAGTRLGPLDGVPITVKDNIQVAGISCTWGSALYADNLPSLDESPVARLRAAGAVILGKTNVPEFTLHGYTANGLFGATGNPWNPDLTPGGSSGGAVAAVASGMGVAAIGTDGGGSIRRPCAHTGLYGLKPSPGMVGRSAGLPAILLDFETVGPIARSMADLAAIFAALAAPDPVDRTSIAFPPSYRKRSDHHKARPRILYAPQFGTAPVDPEITDSVDRAARLMSEMGCEIETRESPFDLAMVDRIWQLVGPAGLAWLLRGRDIASIDERLRALVKIGEQASASDYFGLLQEVGRLRSELDVLFQRYDAIMTPAIAALPWPKWESHPLEINGQAVGPRGHAVFTAFANAGGLPGLAAPSARSSTGLPIGFQIVGAFGSDLSLIELGWRYAEAFGTYEWPMM